MPTSGLEASLPLQLLLKLNLVMSLFFLFPEDVIYVIQLIKQTEEPVLGDHCPASSENVFPVVFLSQKSLTRGQKTRTCVLNYLLAPCNTNEHCSSSSSTLSPCQSPTDLI